MYKNKEEEDSYYVVFYMIKFNDDLIEKLKFSQVSHNGVPVELPLLYKKITDMIKVGNISRLYTLPVTRLYKSKGHCISFSLL